jgi:hypothetical protein
LSAKAASRALSEAGLHIAPEALRIERREDRWCVTLPGDRMAWFPANARGRERLEVERRVLGLLNARCGFATPRVLFAGEGGWDLRALVPGKVDPWGYYQRLKTDPELGARIGRSVAAALAEQHGAITAEDVAGWLGGVANWPLPAVDLAHRLPRVVDDPDMLARIDRALRRYFDQPVAPADHALVHTDLGLHNMVFDPETDEVAGLFDYDSAAWADRCHDFRYLVFDAVSDVTLDAALEAYEAATGLALSRPRILLYNAACAIGHLAWRMGAAPEENVSGRTLAEDLNWTDWALKRIGL